MDIVYLYGEFETECWNQAGEFLLRSEAILEIYRTKFLSMAANVKFLNEFGNDRQENR